MGYHRAGFDVVGVDILPQKHFPFRFVQGDALQPPVDLTQFVVIHASPPCQFYSRLRHLPWLRDKVYWDSIPPTLEFLGSTGLPWVCENVPGSPLQGIMLCGQSFGLPIYRHRLFASNVALLCPPHEPHRGITGMGRGVNACRNRHKLRGSASYQGVDSGIVTVAGGQFLKADGQRALGIDWMTNQEMRQAIPPAYTEFVGRQLMRAIGQ
jgi:DNA (cytosine-5)-methyltransferase 1